MLQWKIQEKMNFQENAGLIQNNKFYNRLYLQSNMESLPSQQQQFQQQPDLPLSHHSQQQQMSTKPPGSQGAASVGAKPVTTSDKVELDHAIGFSGKVVRSVHLHPNARDYVLIAGCSIVIGDLSDPHNQNFLTAHDDQITCLAIANQGNLIASGQKGDNSDIVLWDFTTKRALFRLSEHDYEVSHLDFSHDDRLLLSVGSQLDGKLFIWDTSNGYIVSKIQLIPTLYTEAPKCIKWGGFQKDIKLRNTSKYQFAVSGAKKLNLWSLDPSNGQCQPDLINTGTFVRDYSCLAFSKPTEEFLFAGTLSGDFCCFQVKNKILVFTQNVCAQGIKCIQAVTNDKIAVGGGDGQIVLFHVDQNFCQALLKTSIFGSVNSLSASVDGLQMLCSTDKGFIYRMRVSDFSKMLLCENHTEAVVDTYFMPGVSDKFSTCSEDGTIRLWDSNDYSVTARCSVLSMAGVFPICSLFTDEVIISGWSDGKIRSFKIEGSAPLWQIDNAHKNGVTAICLSFNQKFICSGGFDGEVRVWEIRSRELVSHLKEHTSKVTKVQVFPDDVHLMTAARDRSILCWDLKQEKRVANQTQRMGGINSFAIATLDNNKFISVGQERKITYWDIRKPQPEVTLESSPFKGESDELMSICISHNNRYFATGGLLGVIRIYDFASGAYITECRAHSSSITCVQFSPDDKQLVSTGRDGLVVVWNFFM